MAEVELKHEKAKLVKTLKRWDLVFFSVCAIIGLDAVAGLAKWGLGQGITWFIIFVFLFLLPYGLVTAELGAAFPAEGGIYTWARMAYGKLPGRDHGDPVLDLQRHLDRWLAGRPSRSPPSTASSSSPTARPTSARSGSIIIGLIFVWVCIAIAVVSLKHGKWAGNIGAWVKAIAVIGVRDPRDRQPGQARRAARHRQRLHLLPVDQRLPRRDRQHHLPVRRVRARVGRQRRDDQSAARCAGRYPAIRHHHQRSSTSSCSSASCSLCRSRS